MTRSRRTVLAGGTLGGERARRAVGRRLAAHTKAKLFTRACLLRSLHAAQTPKIAKAMSSPARPSSSQNHKPICAPLTRDLIACAWPWRACVSWAGHRVHRYFRGPRVWP